jgi:hypothetical protein
VKVNESGPGVNFRRQEVELGSGARSLRQLFEKLALCSKRDLHQLPCPGSALGSGDTFLCLHQRHSGWSTMQRGTFQRHLDGFVEMLASRDYKTR